MRLASLTFGYGVDLERIVGRVIGVFPRACEILIADGRIVTLATKAAGSLPGGITTDAPTDFAFSGTVGIGVDAASRGGVLRFSGSDLTVDLRTARPWRSNAASIGLEVTKPSTHQAWNAAREALVTDGRIAPFLTIARAPIRDLAEATRALDGGPAEAGAKSLIGLGDEVTPAGDDYLVGYLGGLWSSSCRIAERVTFAAQLGGDVAGMTPRTHRVSRAYLEAAAIGELSERLASVAVAIAAGSLSETREATAAAVAIGHTSGACAVLGLLIGSAAHDNHAAARALIAL